MCSLIPVATCYSKIQRIEREIEAYFAYILNFIHETILKFPSKLEIFLKSLLYLERYGRSGVNQQEETVWGETQLLPTKIKNMLKCSILLNSGFQERPVVQI